MADVRGGGRWDGWGGLSVVMQMGVAKLGLCLSCSTMFEGQKRKEVREAVRRLSCEAGSQRNYRCSDEVNASALRMRAMRMRMRRRLEV